MKDLEKQLNKFNQIRVKRDQETIKRLLTTEEKNNVYFYSRNEENPFYVLEIGSYQFHFASFRTEKQMDRFLKRFKAKKTIIEEREGFKSYSISKKFYNSDMGFWSKKDLPHGVKKIIALSNGSLVKCYYKIINDLVIFYRPNPNAKKVYKPMKLKKHIKYILKNGIC